MPHTADRTREISAERSPAMSPSTTSQLINSRPAIPCNLDLHYDLANLEHRSHLENPGDVDIRHNKTMSNQPEIFLYKTMSSRSG